MTTLVWNRAEAFDWGFFWDFSGSSTNFEVSGPTTSTHVELYDAENDVRLVIDGTGFAPTGTGVQPTAGTITGFQVLEAGVPAVTLTGMSLGIPQLGVILATENTTQFLNAVFGGADTLTGNVSGDTIRGLNGGDTINGLAGADTLFGDGGNDTLNGGNAGDTLNGGAGADTLNGEAGADNLDGGAANDTLNGGVAADTLNGNVGNDTLVGGAGIDTLIGGGARDIFVLNVAGAANRDVIDDFRVVDDTIHLENGVFAVGPIGALAAGRFHIGAAAHDANDRIIYNANTGVLLYDSNGNAAGGSYQIAKLDANLALTAADFVII